jgi:hypothetical protein
MGFSSLPLRRLTVVTRIAVPLIAFAAVSVLSTASAYAGDNVISQASNQCLDADANHIGPGDTVQVWSCWGGANQHWSIDHNKCGGDGGYYCLVRSDATSDGRFCLEGGSGNGAAVRLNWCDVNNPYQLWWHTPANDAWWQWAGNYLVLDLNRPCAGSNGCNVQIWSWWGGNNQRWSGPT